MTNLISAVLKKFHNLTPPPEFIYEGDFVSTPLGDAVIDSIGDSPYPFDDRQMAYCISIDPNNFWADYFAEGEISALNSSEAA